MKSKWQQRTTKTQYSNTRRIICTHAQWHARHQNEVSHMSACEYWQSGRTLAAYMHQPTRTHTRTHIYTNEYNRARVRYGQIAGKTIESNARGTLEGGSTFAFAAEWRMFSLIFFSVFKGKKKKINKSLFFFLFDGLFHTRASPNTTSDVAAQNCSGQIICRVLTTCTTRQCSAGNNKFSRAKKEL